MTDRPKKTQFYIQIHEHTGFYVPFEITYRVGPYDSREDAVDHYYIAYSNVKPDHNEVGNDIIWDFEIEEEEVEDHEHPSCAC